MQSHLTSYALTPNQPPHPIASIFRPATEYHDVYYTCGDDAVLYEPELRALLEISLITLNSLQHIPTGGTLILSGQKRGQAAQVILTASLHNTTCASSNFCAEQAIDYVLESHKPHFAEGADSGVFHVPISNREIARVLVLNTTAGRFIASLYCDDIPQIATCDYEEVVLLAIATAIGCMGLEDAALQKALRNIEGGYHNKELALVQGVEQMFRDCDNPVLQAWRKWHEPANQNGNLKLFFE